MMEIIQGDCIKCMKQVPSNRVDLVVTSPPYWGLRSYSESETIWDGDENCKHKWNEYTRNGMDGGTKSEKVHIKGKENFQIFKKQQQGFCSICGAWKGQLGLEPHPQMYIDHLVEIFREVKRVLKKSGSFYLNLGDTYCSSTKEAGRHDTNSKTSTDFGGWSGWDGGITKIGKIEKSNWLTPKQLMLIPSRVAIALQDDGWVLRNDLIWQKGNPMPSPVKDRRNNTYEHVFHFCKSRKYYYDLDAIRVPHKGKNPGDLLNINTQPFPEAHFAVYPMKLIEPLILASCPRGGIVLDPFSGAGTTAVVAKKLRTNFIGFEISKEYVDIANKRIKGTRVCHSLFDS